MSLEKGRKKNWIEGGQCKVATMWNTAIIWGFQRLLVPKRQEIHWILCHKAVDFYRHLLQKQWNFTTGLKEAFEIAKQSIMATIASFMASIQMLFSIMTPGWLCRRQHESCCCCCCDAAQPQRWPVSSIFSIDAIQMLRSAERGDAHLANWLTVSSHCHRAPLVASKCARIACLCVRRRNI